MGDNTVSSIWIDGNHWAILFEHPDYGGRYEVFTSSDPYLPDNYIGNDTASAIRVGQGSPPTDGVWLHDASGYDGRSERFTGNDGNLGNNFVGDNTVSSIWIDGNHWAILFEDPDYGGRYEVFTSSDTNLSDNYIGNDSVSSILVGQGSPPSDGVWLYKAAYYEGQSERFTSNDTDLGNNLVGDNTVSSIRIQGDYWAILFEHPNYGGRYEVFGSNDTNLSDNHIGNDNVSSILVGQGSPPSDGVWLYKAAYYEGQSERFTSNDTDLGNNLVGDNAVSSIRIQGDHWAILFEDPNYEGRCEVFGSSDTNLTDNYIQNDSASSIKVGPPPLTPPPCETATPTPTSTSTATPTSTNTPTTTPTATSTPTPTPTNTPTATSTPTVEPVANDDFGSALCVDWLDTTHYQQTGGATVASGDPAMSCIQGAQGASTVWYRFVSPDSGTLHLDTFGSDYDTVLAVYTGPSSNLFEVGCDDNSQGLQSALDIPVVAGVDYDVQVASYPGSDGGNLQLSVEYTPPPGCSQFMQNGGFEQGPGSCPWGQSSSGGYELIYPAWPRTGSYSAWLGGYDNAYDVMSQVIRIPDNATSATLTFWWYVMTSEVEASSDIVDSSKVPGPRTQSPSRGGRSPQSFEATSKSSEPHDYLEVWLWDSAHDWPIALLQTITCNV